MVFCEKCVQEMCVYCRRRGIIYLTIKANMKSSLGCMDINIHGMHVNNYFLYGKAFISTRLNVYGFLCIVKKNICVL